MIVGICGRKRAGKDTSADVLVREFGFEKVALADSLRELVGAAFGLGPAAFGKDKEKILGLLDLGPAYQDHTHITPRALLQWIGQGARDVFGDGFWVERLMAEIDRPGRFVVPDVRYMNELLLLRDYGVGSDLRDASLSRCLPFKERFILRVNRLPLEQEHSYVPVSCIANGMMGECCGHRYAEHEVPCLTPNEGPIRMTEYCVAPQHAHPAARSADKHPSENDLPVRDPNGGTGLYDAVLEAGTALEAEDNIRRWARENDL